LKRGAEDEIGWEKVFINSSTTTIHLRCVFKDAFFIYWFFLLIFYWKKKKEKILFFPFKWRRYSTLLVYM
jgi:hypothetical protein